MRRILPYSLVLLGVACGTLAAQSIAVDVTRQIEPRAEVQDRVREARDRVRAFLEGQRVPGASIAVSRGGRIIWSEGFGLAHLEHRVPATPATRFRVGSISKTITSVALARLAEAGRLDLDAPVQRYAPTFPEKEYPITSRQLGGHLAGRLTTLKSTSSTRCVTKPSPTRCGSFRTARSSSGWASGSTTRATAGIS